MIAVFAVLIVFGLLGAGALLLLRQPGTKDRP